MARIGAITASFMMMWLVEKYDKSIVSGIKITI
jgi:hypothetical protein